MIRHFATDLDGTLLNRHFEWDAVIDRGVCRILEKGRDFVVATGRTADGVKNCPGLWELPVYLILMNGAVILNPDREIIFTRMISGRDKSWMLEAYPDANLEFLTDERILTRLSRERYLREYSAWEMWRKKVLEKKESGYFDAYMNRISFSCTPQEIQAAQNLKINGLQLNTETYQRWLKELEEGIRDGVNAPFADHVIEVTDRGASKAKALLWLCEKLGWSREETAVFGDGGNDVEMLKAFSRSYAPANGSDAACRAASEVIASNEEYGVIQKMLELL